MARRLPDAREHAARSATTGERRALERSTSKARVHVRFETRELACQAGNLSSGGVRCLSSGDLRVTLESDDHGRIERRTGRVIRAESMRGHELGPRAVELDPR